MDHKDEPKKLRDEELEQVSGGDHVWTDRDEPLLGDYGTAPGNDPLPDWTGGAGAEPGYQWTGCGADAQHPGDETLYGKFGVAREYD